MENAAVVGRRSMVLSERVSQMWMTGLKLLLEANPPTPGYEFDSFLLLLLALLLLHSLENLY